MSTTPRKGEHENQDRGPLLVAVACMMMTLCTAAIISRILARRKTKMKLGADDYLAFLAHVRIIRIVHDDTNLCSCVSMQFFLVGLAVEYFFCMPLLSIDLISNLTL